MNHLDDDRAQQLAFESAPAAEAAHLAGCADCRALVESYRALGLAVTALPVPGAPSLAAGVVARIEARAEARRELALAGGLLGLGLAAGTLLLALLAPAPGAGAVWMAGAAALARAAVSLAPALVPLQAALGLACAAVALPVLAALHRLLPADRAA